MLRTDEDEQVLTAGMRAGFPAGSTHGHQLINRSDHPARYPEVGTRDPQDVATGTDVDLACHKDTSGAWVFTHRDGTPYP